MLKRKRRPSGRRFYGCVRLLLLAHVQHQIVIDELEAALLDDLFLAFLDLGVHELDDLAGIDADHVIVVTAVGQLEHRVTTVEVVTDHQARGLELGQHAIDGCQTYVLASLHQRFINILGAHVALLGGIEHLEDLDARQRDLESGFAQFAIFNHVCFLGAECFAASLNAGMIGISSLSQDSGSHPPMQNAKLMLTSLAFALGLAALAGCSFPGVYKIDIQQGNVVTQDMIDQLKPGMTRRQVRFIMGNPLIVDTFHPNRWDYLYSIQPGGGQRQQERMSLYFGANDQLIGLNGDFMPGVSRDESILGKDGVTPPLAPEAPQQQPQQPKDEPAKPGSVEEQIQKEVDQVETVPVPTPEPLDKNPQ